MSRVPCIPLVLLLAACADVRTAPVDDTAALPVAAAAPPVAAPPTLAASTPIPGERLTLQVDHVAPGASVTFFVGSRPGRGACPAGLGVCLGVLRPRVVGAAVADGQGTARLDVTVPESQPVGVGVAFQAVAIGAAVVTSPVVTRLVSAEIDIAGVWVDDFGYEVEIDSRTWLGLGTVDLLRVANVRRSTAGRNGADTWTPGRFSRFDWTFDAASELWYCQTAFDAPTLADALATPRADATDPAAGGCGGFAWSHLSPGTLDLDGAYTDAWGTTHAIDETAWDMGYGIFHVTRWSNARRFVVAMNDLANTYAPGLWSRFDWTEDASGDLWYCQTAYDAATEAEARETPPADPTDPANGGCSGFSWTLLTP